MCECRGINELPGCNHAREHEWYTVQFNYSGWIECECGFRPWSQEDMDNHIPEVTTDV